MTLQERPCPAAEVGQALVVRLEPGLHVSRQVGLFHAIATLPGVVCVTDLSVISQATLDTILLKPGPVVARVRRRRRKGAG